MKLKYVILAATMAVCSHRTQAISDEGSSYGLRASPSLARKKKNRKCISYLYHIDLDRSKNSSFASMFHYFLQSIALQEFTLMLEKGQKRSRKERTRETRVQKHLIVFVLLLLWLGSRIVSADFYHIILLG